MQRVESKIDEIVGQDATPKAKTPVVDFQLWSVKFKNKINWYTIYSIYRTIVRQYPYQGDAPLPYFYEIPETVLVYL
ncbi:hypothetical protein SAMN05216325_1272 [Nitrosomonas marina]|uniref:Uncharacterized protein n=1 Tax=Nitrosomonas marina TaxID=917 RepID=A0A1H8HWZ4_9PROT|nr:hypothetical protein SAMN05216325_1272 [Nitrosomonas marina]